MNYLDLCREVVRECGIAGGTGPSSVTNQTGELRNVVRWVRESCLAIDNLWQDWRYLWRSYDVNLTATVVTTPTPAPRKWDRESFWTNYGTSAARQLSHIDWDVFRVQYASNPIVQIPTIFTIRPDNVVITNAVPAVPTPLRAEYWRRPALLAANEDVPLMPEDFHRIIVARACIMYGNKEAAGEIISGMEAEYTDLLDKLQSDQLEAFQFDRSAGQDKSMFIEAS